MTKKGAMKPNPTKQSFAQLCEKMDKLEKVIKKQDTKRKKLAIAKLISIRIGIWVG